MLRTAKYAAQEKSVNDVCATPGAVASSSSSATLVAKNDSDITGVVGGGTTNSVYGNNMPSPNWLDSRSIDVDASA